MLRCFQRLSVNMEGSTVRLQNLRNHQHHRLHFSRVLYLFLSRDQLHLSRELLLHCAQLKTSRFHDQCCHQHQRGLLKLSSVGSW